MKQDVDWSAIFQEYIRDTQSSYRSLSKKYGISFNILTKKAIKENWSVKRKQCSEKTIAKTVEKISEQQARRAEKFMKLTDVAIDKISKALEQCLPNDTQGIRQLVSSLKDLKDMQNIKSDADIREQNARISNLERQLDNNTDTSITVTFEKHGEEFTE